MAVDDEALARLRDAAHGARDWADAGIALAKTITGLEDPVYPFHVGIMYVLVTDRESERRARWGPFCPFHEAADISFPPPLADASNDTLAAWEQPAREDDPLVRARFSDLLWERRH